MINLVANCDRFNGLKLFTARSYTYTELIYNSIAHQLISACTTSVVRPKI